MVELQGDTMSTESSPVWSALARELSDAAARAARSIVQVHGRSRPASGIVWAPERVLSTSHSVEWEEGVRVRRDDGAVLAAEVVGHDPASDLVLLRVPDLQADPFVQTGDAVRAGQLTLLTGRAWNGRQYARFLAVTGVSGPLQTPHGPRLDRVVTLPLAPFAGLSGGALVAPGGTLAGIATAGLARGRALALPVDIARPIVEAIEKHGGIRRGYLGVVTQPVRLPARQRGDLPGDRGLLVLDISADSPSEAAGLLVGDVIVRGADGPLTSPEDLLALLGPERVGHPLPLDIVRGAARQTIAVTVGERAHRR
jgi:S1-C subfamily serine protease